MKTMLNTNSEIQKYDIIGFKKFPTKILVTKTLWGLGGRAKSFQKNSNDHFIKHPCANAFFQCMLPFKDEIWNTQLEFKVCILC